MINLQEVSELLTQKRELFRQYEQASISCLQADDEDIDDYITKRTALANEIDAQTAKIGKFCAKRENTGLKDVVSCKIDYAALEEPLVPIYNISREIFAVISRITDIDAELEALFKSKRDMYEKRLRETQNTPKIARYLTTLKGTENNGNYIGDIST